jgi:hypothetical protein
MTTKASSARVKNRRSSPDVVEKRRAARAFNDVLLNRGGTRAGDGRTERRRKRLLRELEEGSARGGKRELKPIDILTRVQALLDLGEALANIKKACPPPKPVTVTPEIVEGLRRLHKAYAFDAVVYGFVGLDLSALKKAPSAGAKSPGLARAKPGATSKRKAA